MSLEYYLDISRNLFLICHDILTKMCNEEELKKLIADLWKHHLKQNSSFLTGSSFFYNANLQNFLNKTCLLPPSFPGLQSQIWHLNMHFMPLIPFYTFIMKFWIFQIKYLQSRDSGMYECQVSTQPVRSFFVRLNILGKPQVNTTYFAYLAIFHCLQWDILWESSFCQSQFFFNMDLLMLPQILSLR